MCAIIIICLCVLLAKTSGQLTNTSDICAYTFYVPNTYGNLQCTSQNTDNNNSNYGEKIALLETIIKNQQQQLALLTESIKGLISADATTTAQTPETTSASIASESINISVNYVRYGHKQCPPAAEMIYSGYVGKSYYNKGGGSNYLCLPTDPEWPENAQAGFQSRSKIFGAEYQWDNSRVISQSVHDHDVPCAVCDRTGKSEKLMIPGKKSCPVGWTKEYHGFLMSQREDFKPADYACVDVAMQILIGGSSNRDGGLFYVVEAACGSLNCPPYINGYEMLCVVCTK